MKGFEEKLARLEEINEKMKEDEVTIDKSMQLFEEGIKIAKVLQKELDKMERKVEILINQPETPDEKPVLELFPELEG
ncbi:MAG: exodeoxyribonuclease VII small subunit [Spirochaetia bacterium]|jgi:exodeoxyribonuclease VII small subunit|nr:exodeoxyribonuclease VII small subunit [Spirochaetia bacterium]